MKIKNAKAYLSSDFATQFALSCEYNGARYHVWVDKSSRTHTDDILYKNPPLGIEHAQPGYFQTRRLRTSSQFAVKLIAAMFEAAIREELFTKAVDTMKEERRAELAKNEEAAKIRRAREAGPELLKVWKIWRDTIATGHRCGCSICKGLHQFIDEMDAAIAKAEGKQ